MTSALALLVYIGACATLGQLVPRAGLQAGRKIARRLRSETGSSLPAMILSLATIAAMLAIGGYLLVHVFAHLLTTGGGA